MEKERDIEIPEHPPVTVDTALPAEPEGLEAAIEAETTPGVAALRQLTLVLPDKAERERVLFRIKQSGRSLRESEAGPLVDDPSGNTILLSLV
jgi:hypothetical protein